MAASANPDDRASAVFTPEFEAVHRCVADLYSKFQWRKKSSDIIYLKKCLMNISEARGISLETMERVSLEHAKNYTSIFGAYNCIRYYTIANMQEITSINYISVPYFIYLGEDNTTLVIFRTSAAFIPEITHDMMDIIKYLGVVRVYISKKFTKAIPFFPDNVIQIEFYSDESLTASDKITFGMPQYLLGFYDFTHTYRPDYSLLYNLRFPNSLIELTTSELNTPNLPPNLSILEYYVYRYGGLDFSLPALFFQMLPHSIKSLSIHGFICDLVDCTMNSCIDYLEFEIGKMQGHFMRIANVKTVKINSFITEVDFCTKHEFHKPKPYSNFVKSKEFICHDCNDGTIGITYKLANFTISLGETVSHLIFPRPGFYDNCLEILNYLDASVANNLECITCTEITGFKSQTITTLEELLAIHQLLCNQNQPNYADNADNANNADNDIPYVISNHIETIANFHTRFPNVKIIFK